MTNKRIIKKHFRITNKILVRKLKKKLKNYNKVSLSINRLFFFNLNKLNKINKYVNKYFLKLYLWK